MTVKLRSVIVTVIAGLFLLTGCTPPPANVGVEVGSQTIRTSEIDAVIALLGENSQYKVENATIVQFFAASAIAEQYATDRHVTLSDAEINALVGTDPTFKSLESNPVSAGFERRLIRKSLIVKHVIDPSVFNSYSVSINPRYGVTWNPQEATLEPGSTSLSTSYKTS